MLSFLLVKVNQNPVQAPKRANTFSLACLLQGQPIVIEPSRLTVSGYKHLGEGWVVVEKIADDCKLKEAIKCIQSRQHCSKYIIYNLKSIDCTIYYRLLPSGVKMNLTQPQETHKI